MGRRASVANPRPTQLAMFGSPEPYPWPIRFGCHPGNCANAYLCHARWCQKARAAGVEMAEIAAWMDRKFPPLSGVGKWDVEDAIELLAMVDAHHGEIRCPTSPWSRKD